MTLTAFGETQVAELTPMAGWTVESAIATDANVSINWVDLI